MNDLQSHYDEIWENIDVPPYLHSLQPVLDTLNVGSGSRILDIACGNGILGRWMIERYGCRMYGVDMSPVALQACREGGCETQQLNLDSDVFPYEGEQFDMVLLSAVLEHVMDPGDVLKTAWERLRPGGQVVVLTPNICWIVNRLLFLAGRWDHRLMGGTRGHLSYMNKKQLVRVMAEAGFGDLDWSFSPLCVAGNSKTCTQGLTGAVIQLLNNRWVHIWQSLWAFNFVVIGTKKGGETK